MNKKKIVSLILAFMLILVSCSSRTEEKNKESVTEQGKESVTEQSKGPMTLTVLGRQKSGITFKEVQTIHAWDVLMEMFAKNNIKLEFTVAEENQYSTVLNATIASGNIPDFFLADVLNDADRINLINQKLVMDINNALKVSNGTAKKEFAEGGMYNISRQMNTYTDGGMYYFGNVSKQISVENKTFGPNAVEGNNWCMQIRQDWLNKLGLKMPATIDEFLDVLIAFQKNDMNGNGSADERLAFYMGGSKSAWGSYFCTGIAQWFGLSNGVYQLNRSTGKVEVPFLQKGFNKYVEFLQKCVKAGVLNLGDKCTMNNTGGNSDLDSMMQQNSVSAFFYVANADYANTPKDAVYKIIPTIRGENGVDPTMIGSVGYKVWGNWAFSAKANPKAAAAFLDTICTQDYAKWVTFGVEGETYHIDKDSGMYVFDASNVIADILKNKIGRGYPLVINAFLPDASQIGWYQRYYGDLNWSSYNSFVESAYFKKVLTPKYGENKTSNMVEWCKQADKLLMYNMNADLDMTAPMNTLEEADVLEMCEADLYAYMDELFSGLLTGKFSLNKMDSYIKEMNGMGLQKVIDVRQKQYDRLKK